MNDAVEPSVESAIVPKPELVVNYAEVVPFQIADARRIRRVSRAKTWGLVGSVVLNITLGIAVITLVETTTFIPIFGFINEAGLFDTTRQISDLPDSTHSAVIEAELWQYLAMREGYSAAEAEADYRMVSEMSDATVKQQYQSWANAKLNPQAFAKKLGATGFIRITRLGADWNRHTDDYSEGIYQIHFCRTTVRLNTEPVEERMQASIRYQTVSTILLEQRITFNPGGLVITEYPGPREEGAGGPHPCAH